MSTAEATLDEVQVMIAKHGGNWEKSNYCKIDDKTSRPWLNFSQFRSQAIEFWIRFCWRIPVLWDFSQTER